MMTSDVKRALAKTIRELREQIINRLSVLATMLRYAGPSGCKLIPETKRRFHVKVMRHALALAAPHVRHRVRGPGAGAGDQGSDGSASIATTMRT